MAASFIAISTITVIGVTFWQKNMGRGYEIERIEDDC